MKGMEKFTIRATSKAISRRTLLLKISSAILFSSTALLLTSYALSSFVNNAGNFTVNINDIYSKQSISLSSNADFKDPTTYLEADALSQMDNITEDWIPKDLTQKDGSNNGENFIAYTFYLKNAGESNLTYTAEISIESVIKNADEAIRVKVYKNDEQATYAKMKKNTNEAEPDTTPFFSQTKVMSQIYEDFKVSDVDKYTVIIWLEGKDPECVDDILEGEVKMFMNFKIHNEKKDFV